MGKATTTIKNKNVLFTCDTHDRSERIESRTFHGSALDAICLQKFTC